MITKKKILEITPLIGSDVQKVFYDAFHEVISRDGFDEANFEFNGIKVSIKKGWYIVVHRFIEDKTMEKKEIVQLFDEIEAMLVKPFEGTVTETNLTAKQMHEKILDYNREKFNQLKNKYVHGMSWNYDDRRNNKIY